MTQLRQKGFTIIELLIVIVIIGLLALLVLNNVGGATDDARDVQRKDDVAKLSSQLEIYQAENGNYPTEANMEDNAAGGWVDSNLSIDLGATVDAGGAAINATGGYVYTTSPANCDNGANGDCTSYTLSADLEEDGRGTDDADNNTVDFEKNSVLN
jgi:prepilin-type N-terminal cleavage/methylation domain-containing protein